MPRRYRRRGAASYIHAARDRVDPAEVEPRLAEREAREAGETQQRLDCLAVWRETSFFDERERAALAWAES